MTFRIVLASASMLFFAACTTTSSGPTVPDGPPLSGAEIRDAVADGPYALRIFDGEFAGTTGQSTWDFAAGVVSGTFATADGQTGSFENPISIVGNTLCNGAGSARQCYFIYPYEGGFLEVNADGSVHAVSRPI